MGFFSGIGNFFKRTASSIGDLARKGGKAIGQLWEVAKEPLGNAIRTVSDTADKYGTDLVGMLPGVKGKAIGAALLPLVQRGLRAGSDAYDSHVTGTKSQSYMNALSGASGT